MSIPKLPSVFLLSRHAPRQEVDYGKAHHRAYPQPPVKAPNPSSSPEPPILPLPWGGHWKPGLSDGVLVESLSFSVVHPLALVWKPLVLPS